MGASADTATYSAAKGGERATASKSGGYLSTTGMLFIKVLLALALIPACLGFTAAFSSHFIGTLTPLKLALFGPSATVHAFWWGAGVFSIILVLLWRPVNVYVFFHEVSHALATWLCLGNVSNFTASAQGGQVTCSKSNTFIRLAPYCLPMPTIVAVGFCFLWEALRLTPSNWPLFFAGILGAGHAFHLGFTLWSMRRDQPDLQTDGWLFSVMVIWLANIVVLAAVLGMAFSSSYQGGWEAARAVCLSGWEETLSRYETLGKAARALWIR